MSGLRVNMLPLQAHCFAFGGFEIQMLELFNALSVSPSVSMKKMNSWDRELDFDVLHLWGLEQANFNNAFWAKEAGKKVILTALIGQIENIKDVIRFNVSRRIGNVRFLIKVLEQVDALVVVNELEAYKAIRFFGMPKNRVFVIPNLITKAAADETLRPSSKVSIFDEYFFCAGNISERKNQFLLAQAAIEAGVNMVFAGNFICPETYKRNVLSLVEDHSNLEYIGSLPNTSHELFSLFRNSHGFCLPSHQETQPISVLEASYFGKNSLIGDRAYSRQNLFKPLIKVDVQSIRSIREGIIELKRNVHTSLYTISPQELEQCTSDKVAEQYINVYRS